MVIENRTEHAVDYIIRGGPHEMVVSKGWLDPGEDDSWEPPRYYRGACSVEFLWDDSSVRVAADPDDTVFLGSDGPGID